LVVPRRAMMTGGGGQNGKCTIEVSVDREAEVEVFGDNGLLRTLSGQQSIWRRFQCNVPLPRKPADFRFVGIDGRGHVRLARDPRSNHGTAVVYISDPKGGREGYTFDLLWRGEERDSGPSYPPPSTPPGRGGGPGGFPVSRVIQACQDAVADRLNRDGYRTVTFERVTPEDNPGRHDWISGMVAGKSRFEAARFIFSCSVDFSSGMVRSVDVRRR
jgi:hypothetical protein